MSTCGAMCERVKEQNLTHLIHTHTHTHAHTHTVNVQYHVSGSSSCVTPMQSSWYTKGHPSQHSRFPCLLHSAHRSTLPCESIEECVSVCVCVCVCTQVMSNSGGRKQSQIANHRYLWLGPHMVVGLLRCDALAREEVPQKLGQNQSQCSLACNNNESRRIGILEGIRIATR
jgi:hypothetical protein